jgi:hypothetical protein
MKVRELSVALAELDDALEHYRAIDPRLATGLLTDIDGAKQAIRRFPQAWKPFPSGVRGLRIERRLELSSLLEIRHRGPPRWQQN